MWFSFLSHNRQFAISGERRRARDSRRQRLVFRPAVAALEGRKLLSTVKVTNNLDSGIGSLRAAITKAQNNDTIVFAPKLDGQTITLTSGELVINKSLTIQGPGAGQLAVSGGNASRVFEVDGAQASVSLSGLTIADGNGQGGTDPYYGGAIFNGPGATLTLAACTLSGSNSGIDYGGAIDNHYGTLTVSSSTLSGNSAIDGGGAIDNYYGTLSVSNSTFSGDYATGGGAILNWGTLTVSNSSLTGDSAAFGGAVENIAGTLTLSNSTLLGNSANTGGAIYIYSGSLTVSNTTLSDNSVPQGGHGSAIYMISGNVTVTGCTLTDSASGYGYSIWVDGGSLTVKNSSFHNPDGLYINGPYTDGGGNTFA
jgi:hypothetical protein